MSAFVATAQTQPQPPAAAAATTLPDRSAPVSDLVRAPVTILSSCDVSRVKVGSSPSSASSSPDRAARRVRRRVTSTDEAEASDACMEEVTDGDDTAEDDDDEGCDDILTTPTSQGATPLPGNIVHHEVEDGIEHMMRRREQMFRPRPDYLDWHPQINRRMRAVLFDWMVEVGQEYVLKRQTIHMAFFFVDRYLSSVTEVPRSMLQLVGVVALYLASKSEEIFPPRCQDFQLTTDGAYQINEMKAMELKMITVLNWRLTPVTCYNWVSYYLQKLYRDSDQEGSDAAASSHAAIHSWMRPPRYPGNVIDRVMEIVDCAMLDIASVGFLPSMISATVLMAHFWKIGNEDLMERMQRICMYTTAEMEPCSEWLATFALTLTSNEITAHTQLVHFARELPQTDWCSLQRHHCKALNLYRRYEEMLREQEERTARGEMQASPESRRHRSPSEDGAQPAEGLETDEEL